MRLPTTATCNLGDCSAPMLTRLFDDHVVVDLWRVPRLAGNLQQALEQLNQKIAKAALQGPAPSGDGVEEIHDSLDLRFSRIMGFLGCSQPPLELIEF